ncbi:hypothetical protein [Nocardioides marmoraquaticus]
MTTYAARLLAPVLVLALTTAACGGDDTSERPSEAESSPSVALPTGDVEVPEGVDLTPSGTALDFGDTATVAYEAGRDRGSVLELTVLGATKGRVRDLSAFQLDDATRASTPYYVRVRVANAGPDDLGGAAVPLFAVDGRDTLVQPSSFTAEFERCPSTPLPEKFVADAKATRCLVYLLPDKGTLEAVSYRPLQSFEAITWTGDVARPRR